MISRPTYVPSGESWSLQPKLSWFDSDVHKKTGQRPQRWILCNGFFLPLKIDLVSHSWMLEGNILYLNIQYSWHIPSESKKNDIVFFEKREALLSQGHVGHYIYKEKENTMTPVKVVPNKFSRAIWWTCRPCRALPCEAFSLVVL